MKPIDVFEEIGIKTCDINAGIRHINRVCNQLNGLIATIPGNAVFPLSNFAGKRVQLHNCHCIKGEVLGSVRLPYVVGDDPHNRTAGAGKVLEVKLNKYWLIQ